MMKKMLASIAVCGLLIVGAVACNAEKTGEDTYKVEVPSDQAEAAAANAAQQTETAVDSAGQAVEQGARKATQQTGEALSEAGQNLQDAAQPGDQDSTAKGTR